MNQIVIPCRRPPGVAGFAFLIAGIVHGQAQVFPQRVGKRMLKAAQRIHPAPPFPMRRSVIPQALFVPAVESAAVSIVFIIPAYATKVHINGG